MTGITLAQYAGVLAGLAEELELEIVLRTEGVDAGAWPQGEEAWSDHLASLPMDDPMEAQFDELVVAATDRYGRAIPPLDTELEAWLDFVRVWGESAAPLEMLGELGLRASDITRLHRAWARRLADAPALQKQALAVLGRPPEHLPIPKPAPLKPIPAPSPDASAERRPIAIVAERKAPDAEAAPALPEVLFAPIASAEPSEPPMEPPIEPVMPTQRDAEALPEWWLQATSHLTFLEYASYRAELTRAPHLADSIHAKWSMSDPARREEVERWWTARLARDPAEASEWMAVYERMLRGR